MFPGETPERIQHALLGNDITGAINYLLDDDSKWKMKKWYLNFPYINPLMTKLLQNGPFIILLCPECQIILLVKGKPLWCQWLVKYLAFQHLVQLEAK